MNLPSFSVRNPLLVNLLTFFAAICGVLSIFSIQREAFPPISFDVVTVKTVYPGALPSVVEKAITIKLEDELKGVEGIDETMSVSTESLSMVVLQLDPDMTNRQKVVNDIQRAVDRVRDLPSEVEDPPAVNEIEAKDRPIITLSLSGLPYGELHHHAKDIEDVLLEIPEVSAVRRLGYREPEIWVEADPQKLSYYHFSLSEVMEEIRRHNVNLAGGVLNPSGEEFIIRTDGEFRNAQDVARVILRSNDQGRLVRVADVARVFDTHEDDDQLYKTDGKQSINLMVIKKESADIIRLSDKIKETAEVLKDRVPDGLDINLVDDLSFFVKRRLRVMVNNGSQGAVLILILLFLMLTPQIAATAALDIPITFLATIAVMTALGVTMNLMTMFGMIMVVGMLVDDAIIMAENIFRHMEKGKNPHQAAIEGGNEVMRPVTTSVLTTMCAYLPLILMSGIIGKFVRVIPIVVCLALFISWVNTMLAVPTHAAEFTIIARNRWTLRKRHWFDPIRDFYLRLLRFMIDRRYLVGVGIGIFLTLTLVLAFFKVKFVLFTSEGMDQFYVRAEAPIGTKLDETARYLEPVEKRIMELPRSELQNIITEVGVSQDVNMAAEARAERGTHLAQIRVLLTPASTRERDAKLIIQEIEESLGAFGGFEKLFVDNVRPGPPVGKAVEVRLRGNDFESLLAVTREMKEYLASIEGVGNIQDDLSQGKDEIQVVIDREKAAQALLSYEDIARDVRNAFEGGIATRIQKSDEEINIRVKFPENYKFAEASLDLVLIPNERGNLIPLKRIATFERTPGISSIKRFDRKRLITVSADVDETKATSVGVNRMLMHEFKDVGKQYYGVSLNFGGEAQRTKESLRSLGQAFLMALLLIFFIISIQFRSLIQPLVVMITIPLGIVGVVWALYFHGKPLGFMSVMGLIGLTGVVVNDSIVLIDFMNRLRRQGMNRRDSIIEACRTRFRAVILASFTTVLGTLPMAYGWGGDDPFVRPMALAFSWGLAFSTTITLFAIPCVYSIMDDLSVKFLRHETVKRTEEPVAT